MADALAAVSETGRLGRPSDKREFLPRCRPTIAGPRQEREMQKPKKGKAVAPPGPTFTGKLAEPVDGAKRTAKMLSANGLEGQAAVDEANDAMWAECLGKLPLLAAHYNIEWDENSPDWSQLALAMAFDLIPGFKFKLPEIQAPPKAGRPSERDWNSLYLKAERLKKQGMNKTEACRRISMSDPEFQGLDPNTLVARYNEVARERVHAAAEAILNEPEDGEKLTDMRKPN